MLDRLIRFYKACPPVAPCVSGIWDHLVTVYQASFINALNAGDASALESSLKTLFNAGALHGLDGPGDALTPLLAQRMGVVACPNPEQPSPTRNFCIEDEANAVREIETQLGISIEFPPCFGFGSATKTSKFYLYCAIAHSIRLRLRGSVPRNVLEIGGGIGHLAMITYRWKSQSYTVIDLPSVAVMSAYLLSQCVPESDIWLYSEPPNSRAFAHYYPSSDYAGVRGSQFDLVLNTDSFPEIPNAEQDKYLARIREVLVQTGMFLSVNHESDKADQRSVREAMRANGNPLDLVARYPFWMRAGYVEEIYVPRTH